MNATTDGHHVVMEIFKQANSRLGLNTLNLPGVDATNWRDWCSGKKRISPYSAHKTASIIWKLIDNPEKQRLRDDLCAMIRLQASNPPGGWNKETFPALFHRLASEMSLELPARSLREAKSGFAEGALFEELATPTLSPGRGNSGPLRADFEIEVVRRGEKFFIEPKREKLGAPVTPECFVRLYVRLSMAAHVLVLWITGKGVVQPLHPWRNFGWQEMTESVATIQLSVPDAKTEAYPVETANGLETVVVLVSEKGIEASLFRQIPHRLPSKFPSTIKRRGLFRSDASQIMPFRFTKAEYSIRAPDRTKLGKPATVDDPVQFRHGEIEASLGGCFDLIQGLSFFTSPPIK